MAAAEGLTPRGLMAKIRAKAARDFNVSEGTAKSCYLMFKRIAKSPMDLDNWRAPLLYWNAVRVICEEQGLDYYEVHTSQYFAKKWNLKF